MIYCRMVEQVNDQSVLQMLRSTVAKEFEERRKEKKLCCLNFSGQSTFL